jgi:ABC-2 type transport system ATP-binding protein
MIEINNITVKYRSVIILDSLTINFNEGESVAICGVNGAGKSTLLKALADFLPLFKGFIAINNDKIGFDKYKYRSNIGYLLDKPFYLEHLTVFEYLRFIGSFYHNLKITDLRINNALKDFLLYDSASVLIRKLSKGMRKRVELVSALIHSPKILFLDEPFDGLDIKMIDKVIQLLKKITDENGIIVFVSHDLYQISNLANRIIIIKDQNIQFDKSDIFSLDGVNKILKDNI